MLKNVVFEYACSYSLLHPASRATLDHHWALRTSERRQVQPRQRNSWREGRATSLAAGSHQALLPFSFYSSFIVECDRIQAT